MDNVFYDYLRDTEDTSDSKSYVYKYFRKHDYVASLASATVRENFGSYNASIVILIDNGDTELANFVRLGLTPDTLSPNDIYVMFLENGEMSQTDIFEHGCIAPVYTLQITRYERTALDQLSKNAIESGTTISTGFVKRDSMTQDSTKVLFTKLKNKLKEK